VRETRGFFEIHLHQLDRDLPEAFQRRARLAQRELVLLELAGQRVRDLQRE
jgi:hypothetical protein